MSYFTFILLCDRPCTYLVTNGFKTTRHQFTLDCFVLIEFIVQNEGIKWRGSTLHAYGFKSVIFSDDFQSKNMSIGNTRYTSGLGCKNSDFKIQLFWQRHLKNAISSLLFYEMLYFLTHHAGVTCMSKERQTTKAY